MKCGQKIHLMLVVIASLAAAALYGWIELMAKSPVILPIDLGRDVERSATFSIYGTGLYEIVFEVEKTASRLELICKMGASINEVSSPDCKTNPVDLSWSIYQHGTLVARDEYGPENAVDGVVRLFDRRAERGIGSVRLHPGSGYFLVVRSNADARSLGLVHPVVLVRMHPWSVENHLSLVILFLGLAFAAAAALVWLLTSFILAIVRGSRAS